MVETDPIELLLQLVVIQNNVLNFNLQVGHISLINKGDILKVPQSQIIFDECQEFLIYFQSSVLRQNIPALI